MGVKEDKKIGFLDLLMTGIGAIIGPSIFVILGYAISMIQGLVFMAFVISGCLFLIVSFNYAELATMFPTIGGNYYYVREAYGGIVAYLNGITLWFAYVAYGALSALGFGYIVNYATGLNPIILALIAIISFSIVNIIGAKESAKLQVLLTIILLTTLFILIIGGLIKPWSSISYALRSDSLTFWNLIKASAFVSVSYLGFDVVCVMAEKVKKPEETIPRALLLSIIVSIVVYSLVALSAVLAVPWNILSNKPSPLSIVAESLFGFPGLILITVCGALATLTTLNSSITTASYVMFSMTKDEYLSETFGYLHPKYNTPIFAIAFTSITTILIAFSGLIDLVTCIADVGVFISLALVSLSVISLRKQRELVRIFKVPVYPYLPILGALLCILFAIIVEPMAVIFWLGLVFIALLKYFLNLISIERQRFAISGLAFGAATILLIAMDFFKIKITQESMQFLVNIIENYLLIQGTLALIAGIILMFPITVFAYILSKLRSGEFIHLHSRKITVFSKIVDRILVLFLVSFAILNIFVFYGLYYGFLEIASVSDAESHFFSIFFSLLIIMTSIADLFVAAYLINRKYVFPQ